MEAGSSFVGECCYCWWVGSSVVVDLVDPGLRVEPGILRVQESGLEKGRLKPKPGLSE